MLSCKKALWYHVEDNVEFITACMYYTTGMVLNKRLLSLSSCCILHSRSQRNSRYVTGHVYFCPASMETQHYWSS